MRYEYSYISVGRYAVAKLGSIYTSSAYRLLFSVRLKSDVKRTQVYESAYMI